MVTIMEKKTIFAVLHQTYVDNDMAYEPILWHNNRGQRGI